MASISAIDTFGLSGANPAGQSVTVPGDTTAIVLMAIGYRNSGAGLRISSLILGAQSFSELSFANGGTAGDCVSIWGLNAPVTGAGTLDWAWTGTPEGGPVVKAIYLSATHASTPFRDADGLPGVDSSPKQVTLDSEATDLVIGMGGSFAPSVPEMDPSGAGQTLLEGSPYTFNFATTRLAYKNTPGSPTTNFNLGSGDFTSLGAISIMTAAGGGGSSIGAIVHHLRQQGVL